MGAGRVRSCCRNSEERWWWLGLGGASGGGGLWTDSGQCQEEEMQRPAARLAQGLAAPGTWVARWMVIPLTEI